MKNKKPYTLEEIKRQAILTTVEESPEYTDEFGNVHDIDEDIRLAEEQISKMQVNVNFRWNQSEVERAKKIAEKKGLKYQTYIKSTLKQQMDKDEKDIAS